MIASKPGASADRVTPSSDTLASAIGLRLLSVLCFAVMNAGIKLAERSGAGLGEILFFRQAGAAMLVAIVVASGPGLASVATQRLGAHVSRAVVGLISMAFTFAAILALPLAEATIIGFSVPIWATIFGALILREPTGIWRWGAVLAGFVGVIIVTQPGGGDLPVWGLTCGMVAAFLTGIIMILLRQIGRTEAALTTVFWFSTLSLIPLGVVYALSAKPHPAETWGWLALIGIAGGTAQIAMTSSLRRGAVSLVVPMDYSSLLWATLFGWAIFGTLPAETTWIGAPIIIASGLVIVWREAVRRRRTTLAAESGEIG